MVGGTGEAGQTMLARGHRLAKGRGLVGRAAETNAVVLVPDTSKEPGWLPNELLPETKSEIAVPISVGTEVLGVVDVQHNIVNGLSEQDADLMQSIANQVAIALQNANVYIEAKRRADRETLIGSISQKIQSATTIEDALQVAIRELGHALNAKRSSVQLNLQPTDDSQK
jgi:GAF domain-containing protein